MVTVVGGGAWGTALAAVAARASPEREVYLVVRNSDVCTEINTRRTNRQYTGDILIPGNVIAVQEFRGTQAGTVVIAVPTQHTRAACILVSERTFDDQVVVMAAKGMECQRESASNRAPLLMSEVASDILPNNPIAVISGPSFANEVLAEEPTMVTLGGASGVCSKVSQDFSSEVFNIEITEDIIGVQLCGALKNVLGVAFGMAIGANWGHNAKARLLVQALHEMALICAAMGGSRNTVGMSCGVGDLFLSCESMVSRNTRLGYSLARGDNSDARPEGYYMASAVFDLSNKLSLRLPICNMVYNILYTGVVCEDALEEMIGSC